MMKRIFLLTAIALLTGLATKAQNLWIYSTNGNVDVFSNGLWGAAESYQKLTQSDSIRFTEGSSITILDRQNEKLYAVQKQGSHSVKSIITDSQAKSKKQSKDVISYLWNSLKGNNSADDYRKSAGVVYRDNDINAAIASAISTMSTNLPVEFYLLDGETDYLIGEVATVGNSATVKVKNHSAMDLFVNLIDVDVNGNMTPCIPISSAQQMAQLLIPAGAEVVLNSFPIIFAEPRGEDKLILVASPEWFDIEAVVANIQNGKSTSLKINVGVSCQRLIVK